MAKFFFVQSCRQFGTGGDGECRVTKISNMIETF